MNKQTLVTSCPTRMSVKRGSLQFASRQHSESKNKLVTNIHLSNYYFQITARSPERALCTTKVATLINSHPFVRADYPIRGRGLAIRLDSMRTRKNVN